MKQPTQITEQAAQARLMQWALDGLNHILTVTNPKTFYQWECDLLSITPARFVHEYEIKRTMPDYHADFANKARKHIALGHKFNEYRPNYFWFVTCDLAIEPPAYAGWIYLIDTGSRIDLRVKKPAPRLHNKKLSDKYMEKFGRLACYRLKNIYVNQFLDTLKERS